MSNLSAYCYSRLCQLLAEPTPYTLEGFWTELSELCGIKKSPKLKTQIKQTLSQMQKLGYIESSPTQNGLTYTFVYPIKTFLDTPKTKTIFHHLVESGNFNADVLAAMAVASKEEPTLSYATLSPIAKELERILEQNRKIWESFLDFTATYIASQG